MATETLIPLPDLVESTMDSFSNSDQELHVLAVDDSLIDRKVIERLLKISCCKVTAVDSGRRALQYLGLDGEEENSVGFNVSKVNMIITDYWMPGMTGYELMKTIKKSSAFKEIPVVIMSSENVLPRINRCLEDGAEEFIVKPVKLSDVRRLKDHLLREEVDEIRGTLKRKLEETDDVSISSAPSTPLDMDSSSISSSPSSSIDMSPSSSSSSSSQSSTPTDSMSPSRRMKMSSYSD